ncbi:MAG: hypothetical protein J7549_05850 [Variovorax sp.]|nr:hypothetical protein [Variovorax sp.]
MQLVTSANSVWPSSATPSVAYAQLGDLVEMLLHPKGSAFTTCGFCQTLNREGATRCRACGGSFAPSDDEDRAGEDGPADAQATVDGQPIGGREFSDLPALRTVLLLVLVPPILMFLGFGAWNALRASLGPAEQVVLPSRSSIDSVFALPAASVPPPRRDATRSAAAQAGPDAGAHHDKEGGAGRVAGPAAAIAATEADREAPKAAPARTAPRPVATHHAEANPLAACSGYTFIARAVCVNRSCAEPRAAQHAQCRQANRQRRIDESRRNPVLMG